ncbi:MAG: hypothetical protein LQ340_006171, partial [Diploschistes diacapsis]
MLSKAAQSTASATGLPNQSASSSTSSLSPPAEEEALIKKSLIFPLCSASGSGHSTGSANSLFSSILATVSQLNLHSAPHPNTGSMFRLSHATVLASLG